MNRPERDTIRLLALAYLQNARPQKAALLLAALDALDPGQQAVLQALALAQLRCSQPESALDTLGRVAFTGAGAATYHLLRARALTACGRRIEARSAMTACLAARARAPGPLPTGAGA